MPGGGDSQEAPPGSFFNNKDIFPADTAVCIHDDPGEND